MDRFRIAMKAGKRVMKIRAARKQNLAMRDPAQMHLEDKDSPDPAAKRRERARARIRRNTAADPSIIKNLADRTMEHAGPQRNLSPAYNEGRAKHNIRVNNAELRRMRAIDKGKK